MERVVVWGSPVNAGDGSVFIEWFLTEGDAEKYQSSFLDGWAECCQFRVETYVGSNIYKKAVGVLKWKF